MDTWGDVIIMGAVVLYVWIGGLRAGRAYEYHLGPWWRRGPLSIFRADEFAPEGQEHRHAALRWYGRAGGALAAVYLLVHVLG